MPKIGSLLGIKYTLIFKILVFWCEFEGKFWVEWVFLFSYDIGLPPLAPMADTDSYLLYLKGQLFEAKYE